MKTITLTNLKDEKTISEGLVTAPKKIACYVDAWNNSEFSEQELRSLFRNSGYRAIIKTLFLEGFDNKVNLATLRNNGIISEEEAPRINTMISEINFEKLRHLGRKDK